MGSRFKYVVGIDEAGRGPLAGPVAVGAVTMLWENYEAYLKRPAPTKNFLRIGALKTKDADQRIPVGKDSKKMSVKQRDFWFAEIKRMKQLDLLNFSVALVSYTNIDNLGIVPAIQSGVNGCLARLKIDPTDSLILLDGGLHAPEEFINQQSIVGGDEREAIIGLASTMAKVSRDRKMISLAEKYPEYFFEKHKGYGTAQHCRLICQYGLCPIHRRTFCRNLTKGIK